MIDRRGPKRKDGVFELGFTSQNLFETDQRSLICHRCDIANAEIGIDQKRALAGGGQSGSDKDCQC